jgi:hypothetical protein
MLVRNAARRILHSIVSVGDDRNAYQAGFAQRREHEANMPIHFSWDPTYTAVIQKIE